VADSGFKIKLTGQGLNLERDVTEALANKVVLLVLGGGQNSEDDIDEKSDSTEEMSRPSQLTSKKGKSPSLREFIDAHQVKRIPDWIAAIGCYLHEHRQIAEFKRNTLEEAFSEAHEPVPGNLSRDIGNAAKYGWIASKPGDKRSYYVTASGITATRNNFVEAPKGKAGNRRRKKAGKKGKSAAK